MLWKKQCTMQIVIACEFTVITRKVDREYIKELFTSPDSFHEANTYFQNLKRKHYIFNTAATFYQQSTAKYLRITVSAVRYQLQQLSFPHNGSTIKISVLRLVLTHV